MPHYLTSSTGRHLRTISGRRLGVRLQTDPGLQLQCDVVRGSAADVFQFDLAQVAILGTPLLLTGTYTTLQVSYQNGPWLSFPDYNSLIAQVPTVQLAQGYNIRIRVQRANYTAVSVRIPVLTY